VENRSGGCREKLLEVTEWWESVYLFVRIRCILNFDNFDAGIVVE